MSGDWTIAFTRLLLAFGVFSSNLALAALTSSVTIVCNPGPFASIEEAAVGEEHVNFRDDDPADDNACTECFAAIELRRFLAHCLGQSEVSITVAVSKQIPAGGDVFLLGSRNSNPLIGALDTPSPDLEKASSSEAFRLHSLKRDGRQIIVIEGKGRVGTLYGAYATLERLGMRFFGLGEQGTVYPNKASALADDLSLFEAPKFITRGFWAVAPRGNDEFFLWMARNHMNLWVAGEKSTPLLKKLGVRLTAGGHTVQEQFLGPQLEYPYNVARFEGDDQKPTDLYPPSATYLGDVNHDGHLSYAEAHPEWYALREGRRDAHRRPHLGFNFCTSNEFARKALALNLVAGLIDGEYRDADLVDLLMLDGGSWCECDECRKQGNFSDRMLCVQNTASQAIREARREGRLKRNVQLSSLAYLETLPPPSRPPPEDFDYENCLVTFFPISRCYAHPLADPDCTEINLHTLKCYQGWTQGRDAFYKGSMFIGEYYNVSGIKTMPVLYTRIMAADIPWYYRSGARHFHYMHTPTSLWGTWTLNQYLLGRLLWNPDANVEAILDDYFRGYYPTTSIRARRFYQHLEYAMANIKAFKHHVWAGDIRYCLPGRLDSRTPGLFPLEHLHYESYHPALNDAPDMVDIVAAMAQARQEIDDALLDCRDKTERMRLIEDERRFGYGEAMVLFLYHLARTQLFDERSEAELARHEFIAVEEMAERLRQVVDLVQVSYRHANGKNGLDASQAEPAYNFFKKKYAAETRPSGKEKTSR